MPFGQYSSTRPAIADSTADHGFTYVDVRDAFADRGICAQEPWLHGLTVLEVPYHPNALGHREGYFPTLLAAL